MFAAARDKLDVSMLINGVLVDDGLVRLEAARVKEMLRTQSPELDDLGLELHAREMARERVIEQELLRQEAYRDATPIPEERIAAEMQQYYAQNPQQAGCLLPRDRETMRTNIEMDLRLQRLIAEWTAGVPKPTSKQVSAMYQRVKNEFVRPENVRASHIVKNVDEMTGEAEARAAIERAQELLAQGVPFEKVADEYSDCPGRGGDLGHFVRGQMVEEFEENVFGLPVGQVSEIFRTPFGFHLAKVQAREAERMATLSEAREQLENALWTETQQRVVRAHIEEARARADVRKSK